MQEVIIRTLANKAAKGDLRAASFVFNVLQSPEFAEIEVFDQNKLSPDDQAMLDQILSQLNEQESLEPAPPPDPPSEEPELVAPPPPPPTPASAMPAPRSHTQIEKNDSRDE